MVETIMVFVIAIIFLVFGFKMKTVYKNDILKRENYKRTYAIIDRVIFSDRGNVLYYVSFMENGNTILARTDYYSSRTKSLNPGDEVKIGYYFNKRGAPGAVIYDDRLIPVINSAPDVCRLFIIIGILLLLVSAAMFARLMPF